MVGLQHPIVINEQHQLVSGHRRLQACRELGYTEIDARVMGFETEMHERLAHIDENIEARCLSDKDLEKALAERRRIYELFYPKASKTGPKDGAEVKSFAADTAEKTGMSENKVRKLTRRIDDVSDKVRAAYEADQICSSQIDEIVKVDESSQDLLLPKLIGVSIAETKMIVKDFIAAQSKKEDKKAKSKPVKNKNPITEEDEKTLESLFSLEKALRTMREAHIMINEVMDKNRYQHLTKANVDEFKIRLFDLSNTIVEVLEKIGGE